MNSDQADDDTKVTHDKSRESWCLRLRVSEEIKGREGKRQRQKKKCKQREIRHVHLLVLARVECSR